MTSTLPSFMMRQLPIFLSIILPPEESDWAKPVTPMTMTHQHKLINFFIQCIFVDKLELDRFANIDQFLKEDITEGSQEYTERITDYAYNDHRTTGMLKLNLLIFPGKTST
jgi:hypothetical protein